MKEIKTNIVKELMLGNYVLDKLGAIRMVIKITPMFIWFSNSESNLINEVVELPLDENVLCFLGWKDLSKKDKIIFSKKFSNYKFDFHLDECYVIVNGILTVSDIKNAHRLQNLVKAISGKNNWKTESEMYQNVCSDKLQLKTI